MKLREEKRFSRVDGKIKRDTEPYYLSEKRLFRLRKRINATGTLYADRMEEWDEEHYNECCKKVWGEPMLMFHYLESEDVEKFISLYLRKAVTLVEVFTSVDYRGYVYYRFDYAETANA